MFTRPMALLSRRMISTTPRRMVEEPKATYFMGMKKFDAPVAKPLMPFFIAGCIMLYAINAFGEKLAASDEFKNDPRNPKRTKPSDAH